MTDLMFLTEALASVSMSHREGCNCLTCKAAHGDANALAEILSAIAIMEEAE